MKIFILFYVCLLFFAADLQAQVTQINNNNSLQITFALANNRTFLVSDVDSTIWVTDGTKTGTVKISPDIKYAKAGGLLGDKFIFSGRTASTGLELYITDGTAGGTSIVSDIVSGATGSDPGDMIVFNGFMYFSAATPTYGRELWRTDGNSGGTNLFKDIISGTGASNEKDNYHLFSTGSYLLFAAKTTSQGTELWKSDGTPGGTALLKDINLHPIADSSSSNPTGFFNYKNLVLFVANDTAYGQEIWKTDGTLAGTTLLKDIHTGKLSSTKVVLFPAIPPIFPEISLPVFLGFHLFKNKLYFNATDGDSNGEIWVTDGSETNTTLVKDVIHASYPALAFILLTNAVNLSIKFIFPVSNGLNQAELWESDGTEAGTKLFMPFAGTSPDDFPFILISNSFDSATGTVTQPLFQGNKFFFVAKTAAKGRELWISDGTDSTQAHTNLVADINPNSGNGISLPLPSHLYTNDALFFAANDGALGNELWTSDGTNAGTSRVADINPDEGSSNPQLSFFISNGKIIFSATDGDNGTRTDLYVVNGVFTPLPIKLSEFTVTLKTKDALLHWSTLNEINTKDFTIQRSYDGQHFVNIGTVPAAGTPAAKHDYSFTDENVINSGKSIIYYRILSSDKDGKSESTNIIYVTLKGNITWAVRLLLNPVQNNLNIIVNEVTGNLKLSVKDLNGKILYANSRQNINGLISIPVANLQRGMYILVAETNNERKTIKFIKQ